MWIDICLVAHSSRKTKCRSLRKWALSSCSKRRNVRPGTRISRLGIRHLSTLGRNSRAFKTCVFLYLYLLGYFHLVCHAFCLPCYTLSNPICNWNTLRTRLIRFVEHVVTNVSTAFKRRKRQATDYAREKWWSWTGGGEVPPTSWDWATRKSDGFCFSTALLFRSCLAMERNDGWSTFDRRLKTSSFSSLWWRWRSRKSFTTRRSSSSALCTKKSRGWGIRMPPHMLSWSASFPSCVLFCFCWAITSWRGPHTSLSFHPNWECCWCSYTIQDLWQEA